MTWTCLRVVGLRESLFDIYQQVRPRATHGPMVRTVDIDEESLARIGQWPWPRSRLAEMLQRLADAGAATVVLDILLAEPDRTSPIRLLPLCRSEPPSLPPADVCADYDEMLAAAIARGRVVTGFVLVEVSSSAVPALKAGFTWVDGETPALLPSSAGAVSTLPLLEAAAEGNGALSVSLSAGGIIRHVPLLLRAGDRVVPSLVAETLRVAQGADSYVVKLSPADGAVLAVRVGAYEIPTDVAGRIWLYASEPVKGRYLPAWRVLEGPLDPEFAERGRGADRLDARGLQDVHQTPLGFDVPGIEFHAQALDQVIHEIFLRRPEWARAAEAALCLALGTLVLTAGAIAGPIWTAVLAASAVARSVRPSWTAFVLQGLLIDPLYPAIAVIAVYFVFSMLRHWRTERQQRWIRKAFASYVSPKLVNELVEHPAHLQLRGERRDLSFVFTDLEGFTALVEQQPPAVIVPTLNEYLDGMIRIAFEHDGTVDKIIGDAVHVMFGAPIADPRHAERAVGCALDLDRFAEAFAAEKRQGGIPFGRTRIGVNSGSAIVGNFGGELRFDYTAHGDAINTAARLEGANKYLGTRICVSEETARRCPSFAGRPAGTVLLKGKAEAIRVWEPLDPREPPAADADAYALAFRLLEQGDPAAEQAFASVLARWPSHPLAAFHLHRLRAGAVGSLVVLAEK